MIIYTRSQSTQDLQGILDLQRANLPAQLQPIEITSQGFVTVTHTLTELEKMNAIEQHIIAKEEAIVIAYLLAMTTGSKDDIEILKPMFKIFDDVIFEDKKVSAYQYIVVGQVCVDKAYRGQGVLDACYAEYKTAFQHKYDFAITEISSRNTRSLRAHKRIGFTELFTYKAPDGEEWKIVIWNW